MAYVPGGPSVSVGGSELTQHGNPERMITCACVVLGEAGVSLARRVAPSSKSPGTIRLSIPLPPSSFPMIDSMVEMALAAGADTGGCMLLLLLLASVMAKRVDRNEFGDTTRDDDEYEDLTICCWNGKAMIGRRTRRAEQTMQRLVLVIRNNMKRSK